MDYLAHGIWSYNVFHRLRHPACAVFFGVLPDTISWVPYFFYKIATGTLAMGPPNVSEIPHWVFVLYGFSHSIFVAGVFIAGMFLWVRPWPWYVLGWPLHIVIDVFTHRREFLPTPFLWPFSDWAFPGISWANPWFMAINYPVMLSVLIWILVRRRSVRRTM